MKQRFTLLIVLLATLVSVCIAKSQSSKPNIIMFVVDDMGWMDTTVNGSQYYHTPNMERLASESMLFTDAYAASPLCSPTRLSLMTGKYPQRLRMTQATGHKKANKGGPTVSNGVPTDRYQQVGSLQYLPLEEYTIAEAAKDAGYNTCFVGKWHLGKAKKHWPGSQGFDVNIGGIGTAGPPGGYFDPYKNPMLKNRKKGEYVTDRLTDETLAYIDQNKDDPFFLCLWHFAVHSPWGHKEEITKTFRDKVDPRGKQKCPEMASMLFSVDESLGRVMDKLDELKIADNTIILFVSDNGGNIHSLIGSHAPTNNAPLRGGKATIYEGGTRVPMMVKWPGVVKPNTKSSEIVSTIDFYPTILEMMGGNTKKDQIIDGITLLPVLKDEKKLGRDTIYCHFPHATPRSGNTPSSYVRQGKWKLIRFYCMGEDLSDKLELYNLKDDIGEMHDLSKKHPDKVKVLNDLLSEHLKEVDALAPGKNPNYDPDAPVVTQKKRKQQKASDWYEADPMAKKLSQLLPEEIEILDSSGLLHHKPIILPKSEYVVSGNDYFDWPIATKVADTIVVLFDRRHYHGGKPKDGEPQMDENSGIRMILTSSDGGRSWSDPLDVFEQAGMWETTIFHI